tara:strand:- start:230 stop:358 length:129 start_codon:yes stop_codon:yes gene_type:complete
MEEKVKKNLKETMGQIFSNQKKINKFFKKNFENYNEKTIYNL